MSPHELKALQVQLTKLKAEEKVARDALSHAQRDHSELQKRIAGLEKQIASAAAAEPVVSEHALLRFIERHYGVNLDEIKQKILTDTTVKAIKTLGSGKYPLACGGRAVVKGSTVVSITD